MSLSASLWLWGLVASLYGLFLLWYGGRGAPLTNEERDGYLKQLQALARGPQDAELLDSVRELVQNDDGREFVMQNLVRYRPRAMYPPGYSFGDSARDADRRYGRGILRHLLRYACVPVFIAPRCGRFIDPMGADDWHYVAMVRYRSKRDFLRFAVAIEKHDVAVHKWAALEKTHVFPVRPLISLIFVRGLVGAVLVLLGVGVQGVLILLG